MDSVDGRMPITECRLRTVSPKNKVAAKPKLLARRSPGESEFCLDHSAIAREMIASQY